jgi:hypothetical protein
MESREQLRRDFSLVPVAYDPSRGYPTGKDLYYECPECRFFMKSSPRDYDEAQCSCRHITIDIDWGRLAVRNQQSQPALFRLVRRPSGQPG